MAIQINLVDFADFIMKVGTAQLTKVRELCHRDEYHPSHDFWRGIREAIQNFHSQGGRDYALLDRPLSMTKDRKKENCYPNAIKGYKRFLGKKSIQWFAPKRGEWKFRELRVRINPDLGLIIDGTRHLVKLHFKGDPINSHKLKLVFALMRSGLSSEELLTTKMAVIEVSTGRLFVEGKSDPAISTLLEAQAISFIHLWHAIEGEEQTRQPA